MIKIKSLNECVVESLEFFIRNNPVKLNLDKFNLPFVVGSGNAINTGKIIFSNKAAIFCDESNFRTYLESFGKAISQKLINQAIIISASGEKDSVWEIQLAKKYGLNTTLMTCKASSTAIKSADSLYLYKSISEPYTYNVSTYLGMILSASGENPRQISKFINNLKLPDNFADYESYSLIVLDKFLNICPMIDVKKSELFGSHIALRAFTFGHARHAKYVIRNKRELVITIGAKNLYYGWPKSRWDLDIPTSFGYAGMLSLSYYITGKIQETKPDYFRNSIEQYCQDYGPKAYGHKEIFEIIVPGTE